MEWPWVKVGSGGARLGRAVMGWGVVGWSMGNGAPGGLCGAEQWWRQAGFASAQTALVARIYRASLLQE